MDTFARDITPARPPSYTRDSALREMSILGVANFFLRQRMLIIATAVTLAVIVSIFGLLAARTYTSTASFIPQASKAPSGVAGLAAQLGVNVPGAEPGTSPAFYLDLLRSREILGALVDAKYEYRTPQGAVSSTLVDTWGPAGALPTLRHEHAVDLLRQSLTAMVTDKTGVVTFSVKTTSPDLSHLIVARMVDEVNRFNLEQRQSQAAAERRFTEGRLAEVRGELRAAEDRLQGFLQRNREYRSAPDLVFEAERMQREIALRQGLFAAMSQSLEQAKIEEVRDTPVITLVERPNVPATPDGRGLIRNGFVAVWLGAGLGVVLAMLREAFGRTEMHTEDEVAEFNMLRSAALNDLRHPFRALGRRGNGTRVG